MNSNPSTTFSSSVSTDAISRRAYELWEQEGRPENSELRHWLQAEQELTGTATSSLPSQTRSEGSANPAAAKHTDMRPLQGTRAAGAVTRESGKRASTAPFERVAASNGGSPGGSKRR